MPATNSDTAWNFALAAGLVLAVGVYFLSRGGDAEPAPAQTTAASEQSPAKTKTPVPASAPDEAREQAVGATPTAPSEGPRGRGPREATVAPPAPRQAPRFLDPETGQLVQGMRGRVSTLDADKERAAQRRWQTTQEREDALNVSQARAKGLSKRRAHMVARVLERYRLTRAEAVADVIAGRISDDEFGRRARSAGRMREASLQRVLGAELYERMDWGAAKARLAMRTR